MLTFRVKNTTLTLCTLIETIAAAAMSVSCALPVSSALTALDYGY